MRRIDRPGFRSMVDDWQKLYSALALETSEEDYNSEALSELRELAEKHLKVVMFNRWHENYYPTDEEITEMMPELQANKQAIIKELDGIIAKYYPDWLFQSNL